MQDYQFWTMYLTGVLLLVGAVSFLSYYLQILIYYLDEFLEKKTETHIYLGVESEPPPNEDLYNLFTDPDDKDGRTYE
jgi:hypothetical protein